MADFGDDAGQMLFNSFQGIQRRLLDGQLQKLKNALFQKGRGGTEYGCFDVGDAAARDLAYERFKAEGINCEARAAEPTKIYVNNADANRANAVLCELIKDLEEDRARSREAGREEIGRGQQADPTPYDAPASLDDKIAEAREAAAELSEGMGQAVEKTIEHSPIR